MVTWYQLKFRDQVSIAIGKQGSVELHYLNRCLDLGSPSSEKIALLDMLEAGTSEAELKQKFQGIEDWTVLLQTHQLIEQLSRLGMVERILMVEGKALASRVSLSPDDQIHFPAVERTVSYHLSRFAFCHAEAGILRVESPTSLTQVSFFDWRGGAVIAELAKPCTCEILEEKLPLGMDVIQQILSLLLGSELLNSGEAEPDGALSHWEFHDLLFHSRSRMGRYLNPIGIQTSSAEAPPPLHQGRQGNTFPLYIPDLEKLKTDDIPFTQVLESRRSVRHHGNPPITSKQLGEFLYRTVRIIPQPSILNQVRKLYPSGGGCYPIELYLVIKICEGLEPGLYYYTPVDHALIKLSDLQDQVQTIWSQAELCLRERTSPQVLLIMSARFSRIMKKYNSFSYGMILKESGGILQTMYLVSTAMGLACSALGVGDSDLFSKAICANYFEESSVGELLLGKAG